MVSLPRLPDAAPLPYVILKAPLELVYVDDEVVSKVGILEHPEAQLLSATQRSLWKYKDGRYGGKEEERTQIQYLE